MATASAAPGTQAAWVDAGSLHHNRQVPLPQPVRAALSDRADQIIDAAVTADSASSSLQPPSRAPLRDPVPSPGRSNEDRTPSTAGPATPGVGCER